MIILRARLLLLAAIAFLFGLGACSHPPDGTRVALPDGTPGIGFDDLGYSARLHRVLVPAGRSGKLDLIDPGTLTITPITGFQRQESYAKGHDFGVTSVDEGRGLLFATDRTARRLLVVDPTAQRIIATAPLAGGPDYVRFVAASSEVWVTEPDNDRIEVFALPASGTPAPSHSLFIAVPDGPESLVIDPLRARAYTHLWKEQTVAIDVKSHAIAARWPNRCRDLRGIALDAQRGFLLAACADCKAVVLDVAHDGAQISSAACGGWSPGRVDIIGYNPALLHLYLASSSKKLVVFGLSAAGQLATLGSYRTTGGRCVTADDQGNAWVCSPQDGQLLAIKDGFPKSGL